MTIRGFTQRLRVDAVYCRITGGHSMANMMQEGMNCIAPNRFATFSPNAK